MNIHHANPRSTTTATRRAALAMLAIAWWAIGAVAAPAEKNVAEKSVQVWFIRHAESEVNVLDKPSSVADDGVSYPLTVNGMAQANQLAAALKDVPVSTIYSSTRLRTLQTADAIAFSKGLALNLAPEIVEIGVGATQAPGGESAMKEIKVVMEQWARGNDEVRFGSENLREVRQRFMPFWERLVAKHSEDNGVIVVVTHGGIMSFVLPVVCENMPVSFTTRHLIPNTGILKSELKSGKLSCTEWNGVAVQEAGALASAATTSKLISLLAECRLTPGCESIVRSAPWP